MCACLSWCLSKCVSWILGDILANRTIVLTIVTDGLGAIVGGVIADSIVDVASRLDIVEYDFSTTCFIGESYFSNWLGKYM